jgi:phosphoglycolate phosphatase
MKTPRNSTVETPDSIIFDLDGTLWNTCPACAVAWNHVLRRNGIGFREIIARDVESVCGKPHEACIRQVFDGLPESHIQTLIRETAIEDLRFIRELGGVLYAGVAEGLSRLGQRFPLFIVSNCQAGYIEMFLEMTGLGPLFRDFECWGNTGQAKDDNVRSLIGRNGLQSPILIGDAEGDRQAAKACGIPFIHVTYGFFDLDGDHARFGDFAGLVDHLVEPA